MENNKIYNMDCLDGMKDIKSGSIDLIVTDPPYLINYKTNRRNDKNHEFTKVIANDDNTELIEEYIKECYRILKDDTAMYMFCSPKTVDFFKQKIDETGFRIKNLIVWDKGNWTADDLKCQFGQSYEFIILANKGRKTINGKRLSDIWSFKRVVGKKQIHQNQKPIRLIEQCILKHSDEGDLVFDGFMGSGTTAVASINTNRDYIGFEVDTHYYNLSEQRLEDYKIQESIMR